MGFFKNLNELNHMRQDMERNRDVGSQLGRAQASIAQAQQFMAQQTAVATLAATGVDASATVVAARSGGGMANFQPIMEVDLTVFPSTGLPYPATVSAPMAPQLAAKIAPGASLQVKIDPQNPQAIWIDPAS